EWGKERFISYWSPSRARVSESVDTRPPVHEDGAVLFRAEQGRTWCVDPADRVTARRAPRASSRGAVVPRLGLMALDPEWARRAAGTRAHRLSGAVAQVAHGATLDAGGPLDFEHHVSHPGASW